MDQYFNWGNHTPEQREAQRRLEWDALMEQAIRLSQSRAGQAPGVGSGASAAADGGLLGDTQGYVARFAYDPSPTTVGIYNYRMSGLVDVLPREDGSLLAYWTTNNDDVGGEWASSTVLNAISSTGAAEPTMSAQQPYVAGDTLGAQQIILSPDGTVLYEIQNYQVQKKTMDGTSLWKVTTALDNYTRIFFSGCLTPDGRLFVLRSDPTAPGGGKDDRDIVLIEMDADTGATLQTLSLRVGSPGYSGPGAFAWTQTPLLVTPDGNLVFTQGGNNGIYTWNAVFCVTPELSVLWSYLPDRTISPETNWDFTGLSVDTDGNVYVATDGGDVGSGGGTILFKLNSSGSFLWARKLDTNAYITNFSPSGTAYLLDDDNYPRLHIIDSDGNYISTTGIDSTPYTPYLWWDNWIPSNGLKWSTVGGQDFLVIACISITNGWPPDPDNRYIVRMPLASPVEGTYGDLTFSDETGDITVTPITLSTATFTYTAQLDIYTIPTVSAPTVVDIPFTWSTQITNIP